MVGEICQDIPNITVLYNFKEEGCTNDFECAEGKCIGNVCSIKCDADEFYYKENKGDYSNRCKDHSIRGTNGMCYEITHYKEKDDTVKYSPPEPNKICGKLKFLDESYDDCKGMYYVNKYEYVYKGEVEDGEFVDDKKYSNLVSLYISSKMENLKIQKTKVLPMIKM